MADVTTRPEPDTPVAPEELGELSEPAGPPNRPKPESQHQGPFPILDPAERA
jgi:hypothetical protein